MGIEPILWLIGLPLVGGLASLPFQGRLRIIPKAFALGISLIAFVMASSFFMRRPALSGYGAELFLTDPLSLFIALAVAFFALLVVIYSWRAMGESDGRYFGYLLLILSAAMTVALANHLILMLVAWGGVALLIYLIVALAGTDKAALAAKKALLIVGGTDALLIFGIGLAWQRTGSFLISSTHIPLARDAVAIAAYLAFAVAAFAKAGAMPFHAWVPDVTEEAPSAVAAYLPASVDKLLGIYLLIRASLFLFTMNAVMNGLLVLIGSLTIVAAAALAIVQSNFKRLLGYNAVSQVGYMVLGLGTATPIGIAGGLFHMLNHAIYEACLFMAGGNVERRSGTADLARLGGYAAAMPFTFAAFIIAALSLSGIPPLNGFFSKWMIYQGIIESSRGGDILWILAITCAVFGSSLTLASSLKLVHSIFLGRPSRDLKEVREARFSMKLPLAVLSTGCLLFGLFAYSFPLPTFIVPALNGASIVYYGVWRPVVSTLLIVIGLIGGGILYSIGGFRGWRTVSPFIGGEEVKRIGRLPGVDFFATLKELKFFALFCKKDEEGAFDITRQGLAAVRPLTKFFQYLHNGILPTYLVWCLLGMALVFLIALFL